jgi:hypothetical protein
MVEADNLQNGTCQSSLRRNSVKLHEIFRSLQQNVFQVLPPQ